MFARAITSSARFLNLPPSARLLYYDLGMQADDDGIVEAFTVMRTTGATESDLCVLSERGFVIVLNEDMVSYITDWEKNNYIRKDRYTPSIYTDLLTKTTEKTRSTIGQPLVDQLTANWLTQRRLGEVRLGEVSRGEDRGPAADAGGHTPPTREMVMEYIRSNGLNVDAEKFYQHYGQTNWLTQNGKPVDWRKRAKRWAKTERSGKTAPATKTPEQQAEDNRANYEEMQRILAAMKGE